MRKVVSMIIALSMAITAHAASFTLKSPAFLNKEKIPITFSCNGENISPPLAWENPPIKTQTYVLTMTSPDRSAGPVNLWIIFNIPASINKLDQGASKQLPDGTIALSNYYSEATYRGPCPPDSLEHHYTFTLYALDTSLDLTSDVELEDLMTAMKGHVLDKTQLTGVFSH